MEYGTFAVDKDSRRIRGNLIPWDELSRTSASQTEPIMFGRGDVKLPRDPSVVSLNRAHDRFDPIGRGAVLEVRDTALYAEFDIADTDEGDAWLADHGEFVKLSAEVRDITRTGDRGTATLTGAALVTEGAFASAALFAIDQTPDDESEPTAPAPADEETESDAESEEDKEDTVGEFATVPGSLPQGNVVEKKTTLTRSGMFAKIDAAMGGRASVETMKEVREYLSGQGLFELADITYDGVGGVGAAMSQPAWIGEVLDGTAYRPKFAGLFGQKSLTALAMSGWKWGVKPAGATWTGNKTDIASNTPTIVPVSENASRWAGGHDIAREHRDFGTPGFFEAYNAAMLESFLRWLDGTIVLTEALAAATDLEADNPGTNDPGWWAVIDGAASIVASGLTPTGAVVASGLWKGMARVNNSDVLGYLNASLSLTGDARLDTFSIIPAAPTELTAGHALVVAREAADVYTLPGSPIRAEALNIGAGGIDVGHFGYGGFLVKNAAGIVDVAPYTP